MKINIMRPVIIFDIDNTLYNFVDFFGPAFRAMVHVISSNTGIPEINIVSSFKRVYKNRGSLEYRYSVQELDVLADYNKAEKDELLHTAIVAFSKSRNLRLITYEGVVEILQWLHRTGYYLIAYTDAPYKHSANRLIKLGIKRFFDVLVAWDPSLPDAEDKELLHPGLLNRGWFVPGKDRSYMMGRLNVWTHPEEEKKPNRKMLERLTAKLSIDVKRSWIVGDSVEKDLVPGMELGLRGAWAKYGKEFDKKNWDTLVSVSPWDTETISKEEAQTNNVHFEPDCVLKSFYSLKEVVSEIQRSLL